MKTYSLKNEFALRRGGNTFCCLFRTELDAPEQRNTLAASPPKTSPPEPPDKPPQVASVAVFIVMAGVVFAVIFAYLISEFTSLIFTYVWC